jgi:uncharacterized membrane protein (DUF2068 family)
MAQDTKVAPWEDIILRVIAIYKILHGLFLIGIGVGLVKLKHQPIPQLLQDYVIRPLQVPPESTFGLWALKEASKLTPHIIQVTSDLVFVYAALFLVEGVGLYLRKHWAEYLVVIITGSLLPFEIWTMFAQVEWWKAGLIVGNLLIVGYLVHRLWLDRHRRCADSKKNDEPPIAGGHRPKPRAEHHVSNGRG